MAQRSTGWMKKRHIICVVLLITCVVALASVASVASVAMKGTDARDSADLINSITVHAAGRGNPWINLRDGVDLSTGYTGAAGLRQVLEQSLAQPLTLASGDFDEDGVPDLVSGYAGPSEGILTLHRGNIDSIFPNSPEAKRRRGEGARERRSDGARERGGDEGTNSLPVSPSLPPSVSPFLPEARAFGVPEAPEFLGTGDFDADGHWDVVTAALGEPCALSATR
ncbi:MAG: hypothetical protein HY314_15275 [Acidobacteria bacterium]|nr:hypothetical protein [Acidobacteriota bacterium]